MATVEKTLENLDVIHQLLNEYEIVLYNDDVNTFDFVIDALIDICGHDLIQAEQCTMIVHYNGKCTVKTGLKEKLIPICAKLLQLGLSAKIE